MAKKHWKRILEVDFKQILPYVKAEELLSQDEENSLCWQYNTQGEIMKQLITFVKSKGLSFANGLHGFERFIACLGRSGAEQQHPGLTELALDLERDLNSKSSVVTYSSYTIIVLHWDLLECIY